MFSTILTYIELYLWIGAALGLLWGMYLRPQHKRYHKALARVLDAAPSLKEDTLSLLSASSTLLERAYLRYIVERGIPVLFLWPLFLFGIASNGITKYTCLFLEYFICNYSEITNKKD